MVPGGQRPITGTTSSNGFRLFITKEGGIDEAILPQTGGELGGSEDEHHFEAMVASENLPNEPLMPRSHKSSARSFLKNIGQFG